MMRKTPVRSHRKRSAAGQGRRGSDLAIYGGFLLIGVFVTFLAYLLSVGEGWRHVALGYLIAMAFLVNFYAWQACRGRRLAGWQQSLARLALRWSGFGTARGRPLEAAKGSNRAKMMLMVSLATSVVLIVLLTWLLIPL